MDQEKESCILIVEDELVTAHFIRDVLEGLDYTSCGIAASSSTALELCRKTKPLLVLMDIEIDGEKNGIETAILIIEKWNIPVVFLTAYDDQKIVDEAMKAKPYAYLIKPFDEDDLRVALNVAFNQIKISETFPFREAQKTSNLQNLNVNVIIQKLAALFETKKIFTSPDLSLYKVAGYLEISSHQLSEIINHHMQTSFYQYVRHHRIEEAKKLIMENPEKKLFAFYCLCLYCFLVLFMEWPAERRLL